MKKFLVFFAAVFALSLFVGCGGSSSPGDKAVVIYEKLANGDVDFVYDNIAMQGKEPSEEEIAKLKGLLGMAKAETDSKDGIDSIEVISEEIEEDGNKATVRIQFTYGNGETDEDDVIMLKEDGDWKMKM